MSACLLPRHAGVGSAHVGPGRRRREAASWLLPPMREPGACRVRQVCPAPPRERGGPRALWFVEEYDAHRAVHALLGHNAGQKRDPGTGGDQFKDEIHLAAARSDLRRDAFLAEGIEDQLVEGKALLE